MHSTSLHVTINTSLCGRLLQQAASIIRAVNLSMHLSVFFTHEQMHPFMKPTICNLSNQQTLSSSNISVRKLEFGEHSAAEDQCTFAIKREQKVKWMLLFEVFSRSNCLCFLHYSYPQCFREPIIRRIFSLEELMVALLPLL